jgi:thiamine biosynthesis protein ThiI
LPYADACSLFVPANPVTKPTSYVAQKLESELELIDLIVKKTIDKVEII